MVGDRVNMWFVCGVGDWTVVFHSDVCAKCASFCVSNISKNGKVNKSIPHFQSPLKLWLSSSKHRHFIRKRYIFEKTWQKVRRLTV